MSRPFTVQCSYPAYFANTVTVDAETLEQALEKAIETANNDEGWRPIDHCGNTHVDAVCEGADADPWDCDAALPVPDRFTERGEPPVVTLTGPVPPGAVEVSGGRVLVRIATEAGTITSDVCDPPHPPGNKPLVTVSVGSDGKPRVEVTGGKARIRIVDR